MVTSSHVDFLSKFNPQTSGLQALSYAYFAPSVSCLLESEVVLGDGITGYTAENFCISPYLSRTRSMRILL